MNSKRFSLAIFLLIVFVASIGMSAIGVNMYAMGNDLTLTGGEIDELTPTLPLTSEIKQDGSSYSIEYRICNFLPIKSVNLNFAENKTVILGGKPLGLALKVGGLIIGSKIDVVTSEGLVSPTKDVDIKNGDILVAVNGNKVTSPTDVAGAIKNSNGVVTITIMREGTCLNYNITPAIDVVTNSKKLGLYLKEDIEGIGTLTYIDKSTGRYGALGHIIKDYESGKVYSTPNGNIYDANIYGVVKGQRGKAGELSGGFSKANPTIGTLDKNCDFGVFGNFIGSTEGMMEIPLGCKYSVKPGKAHIYTTIDGETPQKYEIEIIKSSYQSSAKTRGLLIRVTDKELLAKAGGIVQGMSGSPIVQNGKLVGAVTHVFVGDPTKGYGTYIDWMLPN